MRHVDPLFSRRSIHLLDFNVLTGELEDFDWSNPSICHGKGGGGGGTNTVVQSSQIPQQFLDAYTQALGKAQTASSAPLQQYQGQTVADLQPLQNQAFGTIQNSFGTTQPYLDQAKGLITQGTQPLWSGVQQFSPDAVSQYQNPYTQQVLNSQIALEQNQDAQQQQALKGNAISSGAWGGDRAGVAQAVLAGQQALANNSTNAGILNQGYNQGLQEFNTQQQAQLGANEANSYLNQQGAFGLANLGSEALGSQLSSANAGLTAGGLQQQQQQAQLNVPYEQFLQQQAYPFQTAQYYAGIAEGLGSNSGGSSTSTSTTPSPSTASQVGGGLLGGLGAFGALGGLSTLGGGAGWGLGSLLFAKRGGRIQPKGMASGGMASGGLGDEVPDLSVSYVPASSAAFTPGSGPPRPQTPQAPKSGDPTQEGMTNLLSGLASAMKTNKTVPKGLGSGDPSGMTPDVSSIWGNANSDGSNFGDITAQASQVANDENFMGSSGDSGVGGLGSLFGSFGGNWRRGGPTHYDDGGAVGGQTPTTATYASQQQPTTASTYNTMTPQQLQNVVMRLPMGSPQQRQATAVLQQKRMMPNVGAPAQGGFGSAARGGVQHKAFGGDVLPILGDIAGAFFGDPMAGNQIQGVSGLLGLKQGGRARFADGGDTTNGIYIPSPPPPDQLSAMQDLQDQIAQEDGGNAPDMAPVPASALQLPGAMGAGRGMGSQIPPPLPPPVQVAQNTPARVPPDETPPHTTRAEADPWLALAAAGFATAAGQSPYAMENIGRGALAGISNYTAQQKEANTVNQAADKLLQEAKEHREKLAVDQQNADTNAAKVQTDKELKQQMQQWRQDQSNRGLMGPDVLQGMAKQYLAGDKSVMASLGYGNAGAYNRAALRDAIQQEATNQGMTPEGIANKLAEYEGTKAEQRTIGTRTGNVRVGAEAVNGAADMALAASNKVDRTQFPDLNKIDLNAQTRLGNNDVVDFMVKHNTLINEYAAAQNPRGVPRVADKEHAREILDTAYNQGQYETGVNAIKQEIANIKHATKTVRGEDTDTGTKSTAATSPVAMPSWAAGKALQYSPSRKQYRDPTSGVIYDVNGNAVQ